MQWHSENIQDIFTSLQSSPSGLSSQQAEERRAKYGANELLEKKKKPAISFFFDQFNDFMILVLIAAAAVSGFVGELTDAIVILVIVLLNAIVGFIQEYRADRAIDALKKMSALQARIWRNGKVHVLPASAIVPGDIVQLEAGTVVPADLRLFSSSALRINESSLTGESVPADKHSQALIAADGPLGDRINMCYKGTMVINGRGSGIVVATGMDTEIGKIAKMLQERETPTPLQRRMNEFGKKLSLVILFICVALFALGIMRGEKPVQMLLIAISLAVAAIPEALPALITVALARGAKRLVQKNSLIRKLPAVETLGSVTIICTDKTSTLTRNSMRVVEVERQAGDVVDGKYVLHDLLMMLNHDVVNLCDDHPSGDPTELAIIEFLKKKYSCEEIENVIAHYPRIAEIPFDAERKCMTTVHQYDGRYMVITKGAAESIVHQVGKEDTVQPILLHTTAMAGKGLRVLAYGFKIIDELPGDMDSDGIGNELIFAGLTGMIDPPRDGVRSAIRQCRQAGIQVVMITGDHRTTALAIANQLNIAEENVYARVSPEQKLTIVKDLQQQHHFVAMTGDGVNDAPSLKAADIGIAMGITGTDVSKQAADMILLDDNFATIVKAIREGRRIYDNIRKFIKYIMTCNGAEILTLFIAPLLGMPIPLQPIQILWINLVTDGLPGLALSSEKAERNIMRRPPRPTDESVFSGGMSFHIIWVGALMAFITLATQAVAMRMDNLHWQTMVFTVLSLSQLGHVFAIRSDRDFIYRKGLFSNKPLLAAVLFTLILQIAVVYAPFANKVFHTEPLSLEELLICFAAAAVIFHAVEFEKWLKKNYLSRKGYR